VSIDFHRLMEPINNHRLIFIDYIDCFPMIDFHRLDRSSTNEVVIKLRTMKLLYLSIFHFQVLPCIALFM